MGKNLRILAPGADFDKSHFGLGAFRLGGPVKPAAPSPNSGYAGGGQVQKKAVGGPMMPMGGVDRAGALSALAGGQMPRVASPVAAPQASSGMGGVMQRQMPQAAVGGQTSPLVQAVVNAVMKGKGPKLAKGGPVMKHPTKAKVVPNPKHKMPPKKALAKSPPAKKSGPNIAMNRPPQEPRDRPTPPNMMPGGEMPYGVQPSAMSPPTDIKRGRRIGIGRK